MGGNTGRFWSKVVFMNGCLAMDSKANFPQSVGVIISTYNHPEWLKKVLWGYASQNYANFEIIVADDGSLPETGWMLERMKEETGLRIKHIWQPDKGFRKNSILNTAIQSTEAEYIIFTDQDCIPRFDFVKTHLRYAKRGHFLSGGYFKIPMDISKKLTQKDIEEQRPFKLSWLFSQGAKRHFKCTKLIESDKFTRFMNFATTARASWNGCNSSGWKSDLLRVNGFNETMCYGGEDRELGARLQNLQIHGRQIRYSAICVHLDHERPYRNAEALKRNNAYRQIIHSSGLTITPEGIYKDKAQQSVLPKKVFFLNTTHTWGGGEKWHLEHALYLSESGDEVQVLTQKGSELRRKSSDKGLTVKEFAISNLSFLNPFKVLGLYLFFRKEKPDVLILNFSNDLKVAAPAAKMAGISRIIYRRGSAIPIRNTVLNRFLYRNCLTDILANSEETKKTILQNNQSLFPKEKIKVIYNGIDTSSQTMGKAENTVPVIGNLGRMVRQKRQDLLILIADILKRRGVQCQFRIGGDGELRSDLEKLVAEKGLTDDIQFVGTVERPDDFHRDIDIFALTSEWEGFGYVLAEAMLAAKPLVAFQISSNPELVQHGTNGFLVEMNDLESFADALQELIEHSEKRKEMGENGYKIVCDQFDFSKNVLQLKNFIHD
jgi:glycosyltransferase involved in cell wall biosynthesis